MEGAQEQVGLVAEWDQKEYLWVVESTLEIQWDDFDCQIVEGTVE